jgi:hypothetical protein
MAVALALVCLVFGSLPEPASSQQQPGPAPPKTIEPALPAVVDMQLASVTETAPGGTALLVVSVAADVRIPELSIDLQMPDAVRVQDGTPTRGLTMSIEAGERRRFEIPLFAGQNGAFPIRAEVSFTLPDGRSFRTGQGATLRLGFPLPEGRVNAGAYEFRAVPLEELGR